MEKSRVAIIGAGEMGLIRGLVVNNLPTFELACFVDKSLIHAKLMGNQFSVPYYGSIGKAMKKERIDAAIICTPAHVHHENVQELLVKPVHIYCEKPLSVDRRSAEKMLEMAVKADVIHGVGYNYRFYPTFKRAKELMDQEVLGKVFYIKTLANSSEVKGYGDKKEQKRRLSKFGHYGAIGVHALDLMVWYGGKIRALAAHTNRSFSTEVSDFISAVCEFESGVHGVLDMGWGHHCYIDKAEFEIMITGEFGTLIVNPDYLETYLNQERSGVPAGEHRVYYTELPEPCTFSFTQRALGNDIEAFGQAIQSGTKFSPDFEDGLYIDAVVEALENSHLATITPAGEGG